MLDIDYQLDIFIVIMQFIGFESIMYGVMQFEMVVGIQLNGEDVLLFIEVNIIYLEELDLVGKGNDFRFCIYLLCEIFKYVNFLYNFKFFC